jgi:hypothetical protein
MSRLRLGLALAGFGLAALGVAFNDPRLVWGAIAVLLVSLILRLALGNGGGRENDKGNL